MLDSISPDKCTGLPDILDLRTRTPLPVDHGTKVEVECISGYSLSGSRLITCIKDTNWEFEKTPACVLGEFFILDITWSINRLLGQSVGASFLKLHKLYHH